VLYRGTRYYLREIALAGLKLTTYKELFNLRHSSLRNAIERIFGILKRRFKILNTPPEYDLATQSKLVFGLTGLYNFIRIQEFSDVFEEEETNAKRWRGEEEDDEVHGPSIKTLTSEMDEFRDTIAQKM
jgi:hypothetical protein